MSIRVTPQALQHLERLIAQRSSKGVRIRLRTRGCSGLSYVMEYVDALSDKDETLVLSDSVTLCIQSQALLFLTGTEMDYQETPTRSGFIFHNPHEKGRCGCGTSFHV
jgi:iron-sulfur cluster assembly protein